MPRLRLRASGNGRSSYDAIAVKIDALLGPNCNARFAMPRNGAIAARKNARQSGLLWRGGGVGRYLVVRRSAGAVTRERMSKATHRLPVFARANASSSRTQL